MMDHATKRRRTIITSVVGGVAIILIVVGAMILIPQIFGSKANTESSSKAYLEFKELAESNPDDDNIIPDRYEELLSSTKNEEDKNQLRLQYAWYLNDAGKYEDAIATLEEIDFGSLLDAQVPMYYMQLSIAYRHLERYIQAQYYSDLMQEYADEHGGGIGE